MKPNSLINFDFFRKSGGKWLPYITIEGITLEQARNEAIDYRRYLGTSIKAVYSYTGKTAFILA